MNHMKSRIGTLLLAFCAAVTLHAANHTVLMQNNFFNPATLTIQQGDTVVWVQRGQNHDTVSDAGLWESGILGSGQSFSFTFDEAGTFRYFCTPHRQQGMRGTINVLAAANTPPTITLLGPTDGATFGPTDNIAFSANATDNGQVTSVEFFANASSLGTVASAPFEVTTTLPAGIYVITATATDNLGATTTSSAITITVESEQPNELPTVQI
jgi:plastocyanin